ncbi:MAG TPA: exosortase J [Acidobacteriaceae bacterium]|nr:exosortase J [Acidobacteriaceae bacterium]
MASLCAAAGLLTIWPSVQSLYRIWTSDDLKSMGMVVPLVCYLLVLRAWQGLQWEADGSWWGFAVLAGSAALMFLRDQMLLIVTINKNWLLQLPPLPLVAVIYAAGMVLLFGGTRLLKAAWFPVLFMWAVIPVPQTFSRLVDLPLQHASATVARAWAHALGQQLTQDKLRLMFTPEFGMFIAPGCNGIRGAITLGLAAVVVGYIYRFRWYVYAPVVAGAVLLGYLFNFLRLCLLVVYYKIALPYPWLQHHAKIADYVIGGCLFVCALAVFFTVANKLRNDPNTTTKSLPEPHPAPLSPSSTRRLQSSLFLRVAAVLLMAAIFGVDVLHQHRVEAARLATLAPATLPQHIGDFTLERTWNETQFGVLVYSWGEYAEPTVNGVPGAHVMLGVSPQTVHDAEVCHLARGEDPTWHGQIVAATAGGPVELTAATYNDGATQELEASTVCDNGACRQYSETSQHVTVIYARPHRGVPLQSNTTRPIPLMLKVESLDTMTPASVMEPRLASTLVTFLKSADLLTLTAPYVKQ